MTESGRRNQDQPPEGFAAPEGGGSLSSQPVHLFRMVEEYGMVLLDPEDVVRSWNRGAERITGFSEQEAVGANYELLVPREETAVERSSESAKAQIFDGTRVTRNSSAIWVHETTYPISEEKDGSRLRIIHDIGSRLETIRALRESEQRHRMLLEWSPEPILLHDPEQILYANQAARRILRKELDDDLVGRPLSEYLSLHDGAIAADLIQTALNERIPAGPAELRLGTGEGPQRTLEVTMVPAHYGGRRVVQMIAHDVSIRKELEMHLQHQAFHDSLTGLPNRALFLKHLERAMAVVQRHPARTMALLFLDLDGFKQVNDTRGHGVGDQLLIGFANRLRRSVRPQDVVARLAGDEFTVLLEDLSGLREAIGVAKRIQRGCSGLYRVEGEQVAVTVSLGVALFTGDGTTDELLQTADLALYRAKSQGGGGYAVYDEELHRAVLQRFRFEGDLRDAVATASLSLVYEPLVDLRKGIPAGAAAVLRWEHPGLGVVPDEELQATLLALNIIRPAAKWALEKIAADVIAGDGRVPAGTRLHLPWTLVQQAAPSPKSIARLVAALPRLRPSVAIAESALAQGMKAVAPQLDRLHAYGIETVITDFGRGGLPIWELDRLPVSAVELPYGFAEAARTEVLTGVVRLAHDLGLEVVTGGLDSEAGRARAVAAGCDYERESRERLDGAG